MMRLQLVVASYRSRADVGSVAGMADADMDQVDNRALLVGDDRQVVESVDCSLAVA